MAPSFHLCRSTKINRTTKEVRWPSSPALCFCLKCQREGFPPPTKGVAEQKRPSIKQHGAGRGTAFLGSLSAEVLLKALWTACFPHVPWPLGDGAPFVSSVAATTGGVGGGRKGGRSSTGDWSCGGIVPPSLALSLSLSLSLSHPPPSLPSLISSSSLPPFPCPRHPASPTPPSFCVRSTGFSCSEEP